MNKRQQLLNKLKHDIRKNVKEDIINFYGDMIDYYEEIDEYINGLDNNYDKISLAQWANNYKKVEELIKELDLTPEVRNKYLSLKENNIELNETINFEILSSKYDFLNGMLDMITTDREIQEQILSLSDDKLELFKSLYNRINEISDYAPPYIARVLRKIAYVTPDDSWMNNYHYYDDLNNELEELIKNGYTLTTEELDTLLFIYTNNVDFGIKTFEQLKNIKNELDPFETKTIIDEQRNKEKKDIDKIKFALLIKTYGIGFNAAKEIIRKYDVDSLPVTDENKDLFEMYKAILQIVKEDNPDTLITIYDEFSKEMNPKFNFMRTIIFENELRKEFAKELNKNVFKVEDKNYQEIDGVKVYDAGIDFKLIVTAIGAYQGKFENQENYSNYWNSPYIRSHGNCCSLIGNNNLAMAKVKNIILGFSTMQDNMLLLSGDKDLDSTPDSRKFNPTEDTSRNIFTSGDNLLNSTRGEYNELVYERRDLSSNPKFYKKNPDYIVFIEEYEDIDKYIEEFKNEPKKYEYLINQKREQERMWQESLKAAKDFGIPIVKINREKCAKNEHEKIEQMIKDFEQTQNPTLISKIITQFHNNRFGNQSSHPLIINNYFSKSIMNKYLERIDNAILKIDDEKERTSAIQSYREVVELEHKKIDYYRYIADVKKLSAIDFDKTLKIIDALQEFTNLGDIQTSPKKGK